MDPAAPTGFFTLPRELHDEVYAYMTGDVLVSSKARGGDSKDLWRPDMFLRRTISTPMLLVCRKIHHEYGEYVRSRTTFRMELPEDQQLDPIALHFKPSVPLEAIKCARAVKVIVPWPSIFNTKRSVSEDTRWVQSLTPNERQNQDGLAWTPSKEACEKLKRLLTLLEPVVSTDAKVRIVISMDGMPDLANTNPGDIVKLDCPAWVSEMLQTLFWPKTYTDLGRDESITWPKQGHLKVVLATSTCLYCTMAKNSAELRANRRALLAGEAVPIIEPETTTSDAYVIWDLVPKDEANNCRELTPIFREVCQPAPEDDH